MSMYTTGAPGTSTSTILNGRTNLGVLAAAVRAGVAAMGCAMNDVFRHAFEVGDALIEARGLVGHGRWQSWVLA